MAKQSGSPEAPGWILSVSAAGEDHAALRRSLGDLPYQIVTADSCGNAVRLLRTEDIAVVVCDCTLLDGTWRDVLVGVRTSSPKSAFVVSSHYPDERLWAEVLNLGGLDVIGKPFDTQEVRHVVETACLDAARHALQS